jgi:hypothetical protein
MEVQGSIIGVLAFSGHGVRKSRELGRLRNGSMAASKGASERPFVRLEKYINSINGTIGNTKQKSQCN